MISQISGNIVQRTSTGLLIDVHGLCYEVLVPVAILNTLNGHLGPDGTVRLITFHYHHVEPSRATPMLIGFTNEVEREFFEQFITVSGVGPRAALRAISQPIPLIARAIDEGDLAFLRRLPGIGPQRAKEIVAKLQGKVGKFGLLQTSPATAATISHPDIAEEALVILQQLQYKPAEAKAMIQQAMQRVPTVSSAEELLNEVYRQRSSARRGFTLMELLVVVMIIGIVSAIALPNYLSSVEKSKASEVYPVFGAARGGYLAWKARSDGTGTPTWQDLGLDADPTTKAKYFTFTLPAANRIRADREGDTSKYLDLNMDTAEVTKSAPY